MRCLRSNRAIALALAFVMMTLMISPSLAGVAKPVDDGQNKTAHLLSRVGGCVAVR